MVVGPHPRRSEPIEKTQRVDDREPGRKVPRAGPVEFRRESLPIMVGNRERMQFALCLGAAPQKRAAARSKQPLVAVPDVPVGAEPRQVELELTRAVCAIDQHPGSPGSGKGAELCNREYLSRRR